MMVTAVILDSAASLIILLLNEIGDSLLCFIPFFGSGQCMAKDSMNPSSVKTLELIGHKSGEVIIILGVKVYK